MTTRYKHRRGLEINLPSLLDGEIGVTTDDNTEKLFLGTATGNQQVGGKAVADHIGVTTGNPHNVSKTDVSLGNVTNAAQLNRGANDYTTFTAAVPVANDVIIYEDTSNFYNKKKTTVGELVSEVPPATHAASHATGGGDAITAADIDAEPEFSKNSGFNKNFGATTGTVAQGDDSRFTDARTPTSHVSSHEDGGGDELEIADLATSNTTTTKVLRPDGAGGVAWVDPVGGGGVTNTVGGSNGITNTGDNTDAVLAPTYGSSANTITQGNDSRLSNPRPEFTNVTDITGPVTCVDGEMYDNIGASGSTTYNLPSCSRGARVGFSVMAAENVVVDAATGDVIHLSGQSSTAGGTATSNTLYSTLWLVGMDSTNWVAMSHPGIWATA